MTETQEVSKTTTLYDYADTTKKADQFELAGDTLGYHCDICGRIHCTTERASNCCALPEDNGGGSQ